MSAQSLGKRVVSGFPLPGRDKEWLSLRTGCMNEEKCGCNGSIRAYNRFCHEVKMEIPAESVDP